MTCSLVTNGIDGQTDTHKERKTNEVHYMMLSFSDQLTKCCYKVQTDLKHWVVGYANWTWTVCNKM